MNRLFGLNGIAGLLLLVVVLLSVVTGLGIQAWKTQKAQATNAYVLESAEIKANNSANSQYYKLVK
ncbi:DUF4006 family protein [Helicobacter brantae]|uniref:DUF4006 domain-containing protein n=1 Tax=Helicobacter brantae TaxID=375927 RepID=A0A3D8J2S9_9HELI|nr:DUF4006 family protein [Helicobacter brantae]RDU71779.1 DUF4006 domain-containing protein [Helicobacter brantae]